MDNTAENKVKEYKFGGHTFTMLPNNIALMHLAAPVLIKYRKLEYKHTSDIDLSEINAIQDRLDEIKTAIADIQELPEEQQNKEQLAGLKDTLLKENTSFLNDAGLQNGIKLYNDCVSIAMYELITDMNIMRPLMDNILQGDIKAGSLDYTDPGILDFIKEVITDFFLISKKLR